MRGPHIDDILTGVCRNMGIDADLCDVWIDDVVVGRTFQENIRKAQMAYSAEEAVIAQAEADEGRIAVLLARAERATDRYERAKTSAEAEAARSDLQGPGKGIAGIWEELANYQQKWKEALADQPLTIEERQRKDNRCYHFFYQLNEEYTARVKAVALAIKTYDERTQPSKALKLEPPKIEKFEGDITKYFAFKAAFESLQRRTDLDDWQKFCRLKNNLGGEPLRSISPLPEEASSYKEAWRILDGRFGNVTLVRRKLTEALLQLRATGAPDTRSIGEQRRLHDQFSSRFMQMLEVDPAMENETLEGVIGGKVAELYTPLVQRQARLELGVNPRVTAFLKTAEEIITEEMMYRPGITPTRVKDRNDQKKGAKPNKTSATAFSATGGGDQEGQAAYGGARPKKVVGGSKGNTGSTPTPPGGGGKGGSQSTGSHPKQSGEAKRSRTTPTAGVGARAGRTAACAYCGKGHLTHGCETFAKLSLTARKKVCTANQLCYCCLKEGHGASDCKDKRECTVKENGQKCGRTSHHRLLHSHPATSDK